MTTADHDPYVEDYDDEYDDCHDDHGWECDCEECRIENAFDECGRLPEEIGGGCQLAATEYCDFECPFRDGFDDEDED